MRLPFHSRRVDHHPVLSLRATEDFLRPEQRLPVCPDSPALWAHSFSIQLTCSHLLGRVEYPSCPVLAATCSIDLCAMYPCSSQCLPLPPIPAPSHPLFIICLAGYFVSLHWPHLRLILYMPGMSDNDHRISLSIRNSYCN